MRVPVVRLLTVERKLLNAAVNVTARSYSANALAEALAELADEVAAVRRDMVDFTTRTHGGKQNGR